MSDNLKRSRTPPRDQAGSMELTGGTGPLMHMISMPGFIEIYKIDRTYQAQAPEDVDPKRTKPDVPWVWKISDEVGCSNPIVGRVFVQCAEALNNKTLRRRNAGHIKAALHACKEDLRNCEKAFSRLAKAHDEIVTKVKADGGVQVQKRVINALPQIPDLEHDTTIFLTSGKRALQGIAEILNQFYGTTIANARFDRGKDQLKALKPTPGKQIAGLDSFTPLIERLLNLRNFQDHTPKKTIVQNFTITASEMLPPMWRIEPDTPKPMLPEMREIIGGVIELAERTFFLGLLDNLENAPGPFAYALEGIPENERKGVAVRYRCELKFA